MSNLSDRIVSAVSRSRKQGAKTKAQLAAGLEANYVSVHRVVNELVEANRLFEAGTVKTGRRGRPATLYRSA